MNRKLAGILGGSGPVATQKFFQYINDFCQKQYNASQDTDYPDLLIYNKPLLGFDETGIADEKLVRESLFLALRKLEVAGVDFIVMPCNTLHVYTDLIRKSIQPFFISLIEITVEKVRKDKKQKIGILSSSTTRKTKLYRNECEKNDLECIEVNESDQKKIDNLILKAMSGQVHENDIFIFKNISQTLINKGAEAIILGCTELPLIVENLKTYVTYYDTLKILAERTTKESLFSISD